MTAAHATIGGTRSPAQGSAPATPNATAAAANATVADAETSISIEQPSITEQIELFLAFVGGAALLLHGLRFLMPAK